MAGTDYTTVGGDRVSPEKGECSHSQISSRVVNPEARNEDSENRPSVRGMENCLLSLNWRSVWTGLHSVGMSRIFLVREGGNLGPAMETHAEREKKARQLREAENTSGPVRSL